MIGLTAPLYAFRLSECLITAAQRSESATCASAQLMHTQVRLITTFPHYKTYASSGMQELKLSISRTDRSLCWNLQTGHGACDIQQSSYLCLLLLQPKQCRKVYDVMWCAHLPHRAGSTGHNDPLATNCPTQRCRRNVVGYCLAQLQASGFLSAACALSAVTCTCKAS